jgi:uncharacterized membrane protein YidH (DUF202 family)
MDIQTLITDNPVTANPFFVIAAVASALAGFGMFRDAQHRRRRDLDRVSLISWGQVSIVALMLAIVCVAVGLRHGG